jgi:8-oxo-dGTP pyrophosphatase MutT (NUDIX family)
MTTTLITAGLIVIKDKQLLLAFSNNKQAFYLPGGKTDPGETTVDTLIREVFEELNIRLSPGDLQFYTHITAPAFGEQTGVIMEQDCYTTSLQHDPVPSAEIGELRYFNTSAYRLQPHQPPGVVEVMQQLKRDGIID